MKKMKRVAANSHHAEASARSKKQRLLEDYLELQKDFVSKKKKLQIANQKKEILLAEVRFLRRKHKSFRIQSEDHEHEQQDLVGTQKSYARSKLLPKNKSDSVLKSPSPAPDFNPVMGNEEQDIRKKEVASLNPPGVEKKPKNCLFNKKRVGKKKTSWQDPLGLQV